MRELDKVLDHNEKVFWEGKPKFWPYFMSGTIPTFIFGLIWMAFLSPFIFLGVVAPYLASNASNTAQTTVGVKSFTTFFLIGWNLFLIPFLLVGLWMLIGLPIYKILLHKNLHYAITNKRVIFQKGVIGRDFEYIDFDQITNAEVNVGFWDRVIGNSSGSILLSSAGSFTYTKQGQVARPYTLSHIPNPYEVFKFFKKVSHDVKTDIHYPNQYRPKTNPGYHTDYNSNR